MSDQQAEPRQRKSWTAREDSCLYHEVKRVGIYDGSSNDWNAVAAKLPRRTNKDCRKRWLKICKSVNKGLWSGEEDERLLEAIEKHGQKWTEVSRIVQTRHADQCAKRWQTVLCQNGQGASAWEDQDDESLLQAVDLYGHQWKLIGEQYFPGKSAAAVRSRYTDLTDTSLQSAAEGEATTPRSTASPRNATLYDMQEDMEFGLDPMEIMPNFVSEGSSTDNLAPNVFQMSTVQGKNEQVFSVDCQSLLPITSSDTPLSSSGTAVNAVFDAQPLEPHPTTLTLTNIQPSTLYDVLSILMRDRVKVSVAINGP